MTEQPTTDDERRERYAETLYTTLEGSHQRRPWSGLSPFRRVVWYQRADAAMAVADTEQQGLQQRYEHTGKMAVRRGSEIARLRAELEETRKTALVNHGLHTAAHTEAEEARAALERVRAVHERRESDSGSPYCDLCANHGDISWPCATIAALDTPTIEETP